MMTIYYCPVHPGRKKEVSNTDLELLWTKAKQDEWIEIDDDNTLILSKKIIDIEDVKKIKIQQAIDYGNSAEVDANKINGSPIVVGSELRAKLRERFEIEKSEGKTETHITLGDFVLPVPIESAEAMLYAIAKRSIYNYEVLQTHVRNISQLLSLEALEQYNYTNNYLEPLNF